MRLRIVSDIIGFCVCRLSYFNGPFTDKHRKKKMVAMLGKIMDGDDSEDVDKVTRQLAQMVEAVRTSYQVCFRPT